MNYVFYSGLFLMMIFQLKPQTEHGADSCNCPYKMKLTYPQSAQRDSVQGQVVVQFTVDKNCRFSNPRIKKSLRYDCDEAAIESVKGMIEDYNRCAQKCKDGCTDTVRFQTINFQLE